MVGAGILDGDLVVVRSQPDADDGEIVAAMVDGEEATVKRMRRQEGAIHLVSENPDYPTMVFEEGVEVLGKVVAVLRKVR
jgi:repressor LexA